MRARSWAWALLWLFLSCLSIAQENEEHYCSPGDAPGGRNRVRGLQARCEGPMAAAAGVPHHYEEHPKRHWIETRDKGIYSRAVKKQPLAAERRMNKDRSGPFIVERYNEALKAKTHIGIVPSTEQLTQWRIEGIPISTTAEWHKFQDKKLTLSMYGLTGCTAIIVVTEEGVWGAHIWESDPHYKWGDSGGAGHNGWYMKGSNEPALQHIPEGQKENRRRHDEQFQKIAVDIMDQKSPHEAHNYESFEDLMLDGVKSFANKLNRGDNVLHVLILSKQPLDEALGPFVYKEHVELIRTKLLRTLVGLDSRVIQERSYYKPANKKELDKWDPKKDGVIIVEYTPYEEDYKGSGSNNGQDCGRKFARARVWAEPHKHDGKPLFDEKWIHQG